MESLKDSVNKEVKIFTKDGIEYMGTLIGFDVYANTVIKSSGQNTLLINGGLIVCLEYE